MYTPKVGTLGAHMRCWLLLVVLLCGTGGCSAPHLKQDAVAQETMEQGGVAQTNTQDSLLYAGVFDARTECEDAAVVYQEFLHVWLGEEQAVPYLEYVANTEEPFCTPAPSVQDGDTRLVNYLCAQACVQLQHENISKALQHVQRALELNPGFLPAQLLQAEVVAAQGDTSGALVQIEQIYAANPHLNRLHLRMNALHMEQQDYASAAQDLQRYLYVQPDAEAVLLQLGRIQAQQEHFADAIKTLQTLIDLAPNEPLAYFELGQVLRQRHEFRRALDLYKTAAQTLEHGVQEFEYLQAELLLEQHEYAAAADVLRSSLAREASVPLRLLYGYALLQMEQYAAAIPELRSAAEALEFNSMAWLWLGTALERQRQWYDAIATFQQVNEGDPRTVALLHLAGLYHVVGRNQEAIAALDELLDLGVSDPLMYRQLSYLHILEQNNPAAVTALEHGLEQHQDSVELKNHLGLLYAMLGKYTPALKYLEQVAQQRPDDVEALNNLAFLYAETEQKLEYALTLAQAALESESRAEFHDTLGWVYVKLGRYAEAREQLRLAHALQPQNAQILEHLGDMYMAMGKRTQAKEKYLKALALQPNNEELQQKVNLNSTER